MKWFRNILIFGIVWCLIVFALGANAGEWNEKPIICEQKDIFEKLMVKQGKIILGAGSMLATVRTRTGLSDIPAVLPMRLYINPKTKQFTIVEWHRDYNSYCILAFGEEWHILGEKS